MDKQTALKMLRSAWLHLADQYPSDKWALHILSMAIVVLREEIRKDANL